MCSDERTWGGGGARRLATERVRVEEVVKIRSALCDLSVRLPDAVRQVLRHPLFKMRSCTSARSYSMTDVAMRRLDGDDFVDEFEIKD